MVLVLAALGTLIAALVDNAPIWAWISIGLSVLAALVLLFDWWGGRRAARGAEEAPETEADEAEEPAEHAAEVGAEGAAEQPGTEPGTEPAEAPAEAERPTEPEPVVAEAEAPPAVPVETPVAAEDPEATEVQPVVADDGAPRELVQDDVDPPEEGTDAADLLIVSELDTQVLVVDEHPRYHLIECTWLASRDTIPIAVSEARELGFTPCSRCGPDGALAEGVRRRRKKSGRIARS